MIIHVLVHLLIEFLVLEAELLDKKIYPKRQQLGRGSNECCSGPNPDHGGPQPA